MWPFCGGVTGKVTLYEDNPAFDSDLKKNVFKIDCYGTVLESYQCPIATCPIDAQ